MFPLTTTGPRELCLMQTDMPIRVPLLQLRLALPLLGQLTELIIMVSERGSLLLSALRNVLWTSLVTALLGCLLSTRLLGHTRGFLGARLTSMPPILVRPLRPRVSIGMTLEKLVKLPTLTSPPTSRRWLSLLTPAMTVTSGTCYPNALLLCPAVKLACSWERTCPLLGLTLRLVGSRKVIMLILVKDLLIMLPRCRLSNACGWRTLGALMSMSRVRLVARTF